MADDPELLALGSSVYADASAVDVRKTGSRSPVTLGLARCPRSVAGARDSVGEVVVRRALPMLQMIRLPMLAGLGGMPVAAHGSNARVRARMARR